MGLLDWTSDPILKKLIDVSTYGLEYAFARFYANYPGRVSDSLLDGRLGNNDPQQQGRVRVKVGAAGFGRTDATGRFDLAELTLHAYPNSMYAGRDYGVYFPPEVGDRIWVWFENGDPTQPHYMGSSWGNDDSNGSAAGSHLPKEFKSTLGTPLVRGIKTKFGHGLSFSDDPTNPFVVLWTGQQITPHEAATRKQRIILNDTPGGDGIAILSNYGHRVILDDTNRVIQIGTPPADPLGLFQSSVTIDDIRQTITVKTKGLQTIEINDLTSAITITTPGAVNVVSTGTITLAGTGGVAIGSGGAPPAPPTPGVMMETGFGAKIVNFVGAITETIGGAWEVTAASLKFTAALIELGTPASAQSLINQQIIDWLVNHVHPTTAPGAPTLIATQPVIPIVPPGPPLAVLGSSAAPSPVYATQNVKAS